MPPDKEICKGQLGNNRRVFFKVVVKKILMPDFDLLKITDSRHKYLLDEKRYPNPECVTATRWGRKILPSQRKKYAGLNYTIEK
jgi:hypothetical protein